MLNRAQSVFAQVCLALLCALGAGFSGDMQARYAGHANHHARHARGSHHRGARSSGRDNHSDHAHEIEFIQEALTSATPSASGTAGHAVVAVLPAIQFFELEWAQIGSALSVSAGFPASAQVLSLPSRGPPALS